MIMKQKIKLFHWICIDHNNDLNCPEKNDFLIKLRKNPMHELTLDKQS